MDTFDKIVLGATATAIGSICIIYTYFMKKTDDRLMSAMEKINHTASKSIEE